MFKNIYGIIKLEKITVVQLGIDDYGYRFLFSIALYSLYSLYLLILIVKNNCKFKFLIFTAEKMQCDKTKSNSV